MFENLPGYLEIGELSEKSNIYATGADGSVVLLASFYDQNRVEVRGRDQPVREGCRGRGGGPALLRAQRHRPAGDRARGGDDRHRRRDPGRLIDRPAVREERARAEVRGNGRPQQQTPGANEEDGSGCYDKVTETTIDRKLKEMRLAIGVEKRYTKNEILLGYLNIAGFGGTVYGIEAAANYYFDTSAAEVSLPMAASLMAIVNNPVKFQLDKPGSETNGVANGYAANTAGATTSSRDVQGAEISRLTTTAAVARAGEPEITEPSTGCQSANGSAYFCDYVTKRLLNDPVFGEDAETRLLNFRRGGYNVYTTLDLDMQNAPRPPR